ncbi:O-antigen ligase family protein [Candidatus Falkowbacteria bacterium]|nr:O-antigen ligase family protein [Candidatus Falkowbacteria bacterium]
MKINILNNKNFYFTLLIILILILSFVLIKNVDFYILAGAVFFLAFIFFWFYPQIGLYLIAFLFPFNYWEIVYGDLNIPYVDLLALILFISWICKYFYLIIIKKEKLSFDKFPGWFLMLLFVISGALSLMNVEREFLGQSFKYLLRPIIFFYLMYIILPYNILNDFKKLFNTFKITFILGIGLCAIGIWSILFPPFIGIRRAVPISLFGVWPLGTNHNSLAEVLVCLVPIALILYWYEKNVLLKNIYLIGGLFMAGVTFLTLSRSGWLAILVELLVLIVLKYRKTAKRYLTSYLPYLFLLLMAPALYLMYQLATSSVIITSNLSRTKLIEIALHLFREYPLFGAGVGTFVDYVSQTSWFIVEYGNPLDAHGFIFKTLAETGIAGTISFLGLLIYIIYRLTSGYFKFSNTLYSWLLLGMVSLGVGDIFFQLFSTNYYLARVWLPLGLALCALKLCDSKLAKKQI